MSANEDFFRERRAQAVFKHGILSRYPTVFASKTGRGGRRVVFLDGYAGRGEYEDGSIGSPVLLAHTARKVEAFRKVIGIYVEKDREDFLNLQQVMSEQGRTDDHLFCGDLQGHLPKILDLTRGASLFAFLDPFGTALDRHQLVGALLGRSGTTAPVEVLLHISVSTVARLGGLLRRRREQGMDLSPGDRKSIEHVDRFMGGTWWQRHFEPVRDANDEERATVAALRTAEEYQRSVCAEARCEAVSMPIRRRPGQLPKYVLVLFTRHRDGMWYFADALGKAGREWEGAWRTELANRQLAKLENKYAEPGLFDLRVILPPEPFDPAEYERQHREEWQRIIEGNLRALLETGERFVLAGRVADVYGEVLGAASELHVRAAVKNLHQAGVIANDGIGKNFFREVICPRVN